MKSLVLIKPDGVRKGLVGECISRFENLGFTIDAMKVVQMDRDTAEEMYAVHKEKSFFEDLMEYVTSGPVIPVILSIDLDFESGVNLIRKVVGATDPQEAEMGSIRGDFAVDVTENIIHASDSLESAEYEIPIFFDEDEFSWD